MIPPIAKADPRDRLHRRRDRDGLDFSHVLSSKLPLFIGVVVALSALLLLMVVFRSLADPAAGARR